MKSKNTSIRFDPKKLELVKKNEKITSNQKAVDFLFDEYWKLYAPKEFFESKFKSAEEKPKKLPELPSNSVDSPKKEAAKPNEKSYSDFDFAIRAARTISELENILVEVMANTIIEQKKKTDLKIRVETRMRYIV